MKSVEKQIKIILKQLQIPVDSVNEIKLKKDKSSAILSLDVDVFKDEKKEVIAQKIKELQTQIEHETKLAKVTIFLTSREIKKAEGIADKIKKFFAKKGHDKADSKPAKSKPQNQPKIVQNKVAGVKKIIAVAAGKGGVGKSTFTVNLAASLAKIGYKIAIADADIYGPSIPALLGLKGDSKPEVKDNLFIPKIAHQIKCNSIGFILEEGSAGAWRGPMITKILHQLIKATNWQFDGNEVDVLIIDMPPGTGDIYLSIAQNFDLSGAVLVSTPQSIAVDDVARSIDCFKKLGVKILGLAQNMAYLQLEEQGAKQKKYIFGKDNAKKLAEKLGIKFLGDVALDQEIADASEEKIPFVVKNPASESAMQFGRIAEELLEGV